MDFFLFFLYKSSNTKCKSAADRWSVLVSFTDGADQMAHLFTVHNVDDNLTVKTCGILRSGRMERLLPGHGPRFQEAAD